MNRCRSIQILCIVLVALCCIRHEAFSAEPKAAWADALVTVKTQADLDALIASVGDASQKQSLRDNAAAILSASEQRPHIESVVATVTSAPGKMEKINATPESLKKAAGGDSALFDTLKGIDLSVANMGPHDQRKVDPYDAAFFEHLSHITALESLYIISTKANDEWITPLGKLPNIKSLRFVNNGKLTDTGLEQLAGLKQMVNFAYVGTQMQGHAFAKFEGWTQLKTCSFRGSSIDDEGLRLLCEHFPTLESISLAHAKFTDAGSANLAKLTKLKGLELGTHNATVQCLKNIAGLPLDYLQLGEGVDSSEGIALIKDIKSLHRLTHTNSKTLTDADLKLVSGMTQLESLEFNNLELPDERLPQLEPFSFLKSLRLVHRPAYPAETQAKIKALLPKVTLKFD